MTDLVTLVRTPILCSSLGDLLDSIDEQILSGPGISTGEKNEITGWLLSRQRKLGTQAGIFSPTPQDYTRAYSLYTGEKIRTRLAMNNILGIESARVLVKLHGNQAVDPDVREALQRADRWMLHACFSRFCPVGECTHATSAFLRYLAAGGMPDSQPRLEIHLKSLKAQRSQDGKWRRFPFFYLLLALSEIPHPSAREEIRHAVPAIQKSLRRLSSMNDTVARRRRLILQRALERSD